MRKVLLSTILLLVIGLLFVFEASTAESLVSYGHPYHFLRQQVMWIGIGSAALLTAFFIPPVFWKKTAPIWYVVGILSLIAVLIPGIGREFNGARRWISIGSIGVVQPIEFVKFSMTAFFAKWMSEHQRVLPFALLTLLPLGLVLLQPDLGSSLILITIAIGMYFVAGGEMKWIGGACLAAIAFVVIAIIAEPYRMHRINTYLNPSIDPLGAGFHIRQITLALGRGGLLGQGIGNSKQKLDYIPEASSDSIFAITAEELGFVGSVVIISFYLLYLHGGMQIASATDKNSFKRLLASGLVIWIATQAILNLAAIVALVPLTGLPLPLFSYGGSSIVMVLFSTGILLRLGYTSKKNSKKAIKSR